jgi:hypothetical protein
MMNEKNFPLALLLCLTLLSATTFAQSFEGTISYLNDFELSKKFKEMGFTKEMMLDELKKKGTWYDTAYVSYKQGDYVMIAGQMKKIYKASENKFYGFDDPESDICSVQEAVDLTLDGKPDKPTVIELDSTAMIRGFTCKIIRMKWKLGQVDYYYHPDMAKVDPSLFSRHSYEGLSEFVARTKCLPLQIVREAMGMKLIQTAAAVKSHPVKAELFVLPKLVEDKELNQFKLPGVTMMRIKK